MMLKIKKDCSIRSQVLKQMRYFILTVKYALGERLYEERRRLGLEVGELLFVRYFTSWREKDWLTVSMIRNQGLKKGGDSMT